MEKLLVLLLFTTIPATCHVSSFHGGIPLPIHLLRPQSGSGGHLLEGISCDSWRLAVETNSVRNWKTVPVQCKDYVGHYMLGHLYRKDSKTVTDEAAKYAQSLNLTGDGKETWVFDIDETTLSNLPYYARHGFGAQPYDPKLFGEWVDTGKAPALPETLKLYKKVISLGFKVVFLTGRSEARRKSTKTNLKRVGYHTWEKLILRGASESNTTAVVFKTNRRKKLEQQGYKILGNIGDEWSDILGTNTGSRTFKLPDPMYYIS
ncbi:Acid phosphatase (Class B) [Macleaya cordata]|uniref:Acid phosphatase (Class B) n=1 Tax=Macleaya cordata TaxID=56857 RepID=A0A200QPS2_MACCD|nr:Acid phosphatase (Class B) [Macleaya cordata]